ncbi:S8 family serine peptidase [Rhizobacter sp. Root1221]|uniref:S8 family serine peptidase n=1 Tax=Rhizobacter sp. Root1221 TaxID=1736433 RepID=UPI0006F7DE08|nr:S8 family serine peptidase [Rhizobacter sp. Root1221]
MSRRFDWGRCATLGVVLCTASGAFAADLSAMGRLAPQGTPDNEARVIVKFKASAATVRSIPLDASRTAAKVHNVMQARADALSARAGTTLVAGRTVSDRAQVVLASGLGSEALAARLRAHPDVEYVQVDRFRTRLAVPNDPLYGPVSGTSPASGQWYLKAPAGAIVSSINAPQAWDITRGTSAVVVAVLDTGIRKDHPDLQAGQLLPGYDMVERTSISNDGDARDSDPSDPGDYYTTAEAAANTITGCTAANSSWHGTQTSGLIGATWSNNLGMAGVAGGGTKVLPVRVLGKCGGWDSDILAGMRWAAGLAVSGIATNATPARVINMSLGGDGSCDAAYADAIAELTTQGAVVVAAAGNGSGHALGVPASCTGVVAVTGLRHTGTKVGYSDVGPNAAIAAPAGNCVDTFGSTCQYPILSTTNAGTTTPVAGSAAYTNGTNYAVGTSFSAPLVSGTLALMLSSNPSLSAAQAVSLMRSTARPFPVTGADAGVATCHAPTGTDQLECYCTTTTCGAGMLDTGAAVLAAAAAGADSTTSYVRAVATATPAIPDPGQAVVLSAASTQASTGRSVVATTWSIVDAGGVVTTFSGDATQSTVTIVPTAVGQFTVRLTVQDDQGATNSTDLAVPVDALSVGVSASTSVPQVGQTVNLSIANQVLSAGRSRASVGWAVVEGTGTVAAVGSSNTDRAVLTPGAAGPITVRLTITDDLGKQATSDWKATVTATSSSTSAASSDSGGGGGAVSLADLMVAALLLLVLWAGVRRAPITLSR